MIKIGLKIKIMLIDIVIRQIGEVVKKQMDKPKYFNKSSKKSKEKCIH